MKARATSDTKSTIRKRILLISASAVFTLILLEIIIRLLIQPSIFTQSPPFKIHFTPRSIFSADNIIEPAQMESFRNEWAGGIIVDETKITRSDLSGVFREDELLGYTALENASSTNSWWQSNNLGARSDEHITPEKTPGQERILIFGDSFAQSSRVPQYETIDYYLGELHPNKEFLNFGVEGYSMAQAYLRYSALRDKLDYDRVLLFFVGIESLRRDLNVSRYAGFGWDGNYNLIAQPRFIIENGELVLVPSPYKDFSETAEENRDGPSGKLRAHLAQYDTFYDPFWHRPLPVLDDLVSVKLIDWILYQLRTKLARGNIMSPDSEGVQITKKIAETMNISASEDGAHFTFVILPIGGDFERYKNSEAFRTKWKNMISKICSGGIDCVDFMEDFKSVPPESFDSGYDKTHFGPKTNSMIADMLTQKVLDRSK